MNKFYIDIAHATSVMVREVYYATQKEGESDEDFLVRKLKHPDPIATSTSSDDHPEFKKLRNQLEESGYIKTERGWWNGDRVLKKFYLNDVEFKKGYKFPSGAAIKYNLENGKATL